MSKSRSLGIYLSFFTTELISSLYVVVKLSLPELDFILNLFRVTSLGVVRLSPGRPVSSTLCTTLATTSWSEPRPSLRTLSSSLMLLLSVSGKQFIIIVNAEVYNFTHPSPPLFIFNSEQVIPLPTFVYCLLGAHP